MLDSGAGGGGDLDTEITGRPETVRAAASWLGTTVAPGIEDGRVALRRAGQDASSEWVGVSGAAFGSRVAATGRKVDGLHSVVERAATCLATYADSMRACQDRMGVVRDRASAAGLAVSGFLVLNPGTGPARPADRSGDQLADPELARYEAAVSEYNHHQRLILAFNDACADAAEVRAAMAAAERQLADDYQGMSWTEVGLQGSDFVSAAVISRLGRYQARTLRATADFWSDRAAAWTERMRATDYAAYRRLDDLLGPDAPRRMFDSDAAHQRYLQDQAARSARLADDFETSRWSGIAKNVSRGLVGVGVITDMMDGESFTQAAASNVGGYAAGAAVTAGVSAGTTLLAATATGAALGSAVPVVGTAVGAVVGLGVGIFASGAIDSLFENGPDVGQAIDEGWESVTDTVGAVGDGLEAAGDFVGDLF